MKIGIDSECLLHTIRGVGYATLTLIEALKRKNQQILCYHSQTSTDVYSPSVEHYSFRKVLPLPFYNPLASLFHRSCFNQVDVMHFPAPRVIYGKRPKVPFVLTIYDVMPLLFPHFFPKTTRVMMEYFLPRYLREADAIIVVSQQTKKDLLQIFSIPETKVHLIHCALLPKERTPCHQKEPFLLYVGSFEPRKNVPGIIQAFHQIKKQGFPHKLILVGKEEGNHRIPHQLIQKLDLQEEILCKGYLSEEEKDLLFQKASLLVWPSFYEGFGLPLLEAMAFGTPIVTANCSASQEIVGDAAICVDPHDIEAIAQGMIKILSSEEVAQNLATKGLERSKQFSLDIFGEKHLQIYEPLRR